MARLDVSSPQDCTYSDGANDAQLSMAIPAAQINAARELLARLFRGVACAPEVRLANGEMLLSVPAPSARGVIVRPSVIRDLLLRGSDLGAAEAFIRGDITVDGDLESFVDALSTARKRRTAREWYDIVKLAAAIAAPRRNRKAAGNGDGAEHAGSSTARRRPARLIGRRDSRERARAAVEYHYNVSNEFYALWLDANMTYSCAYFRTPTDTLDLAQIQKYDLIAKKLRLHAGERVLDIGCGWGGLVRFFAREYGARTVGVTLSSRQADYAQRRIAREGLDKICRVELLDFRDLSTLGAFDKIASVGMVEHVGSAHLGAYFNAAHAALAPGGLFLNHGIISQTATPTGLRGLLSLVLSPRSGFIDRYVFPDNDLLRLDIATAAAQRSGFEVLDIENLRPHYQRTLRHWVRGLEANEVAARRLVGDETYNTWRLYIAGSAQGFGCGNMGLAQMLLAKGDSSGNHVAPPIRDDIYCST